MELQSEMAPMVRSLETFLRGVRTVELSDSGFTKWGKKIKVELVEMKPELLTKVETFLI